MSSKSKIEGGHGGHEGGHGGHDPLVLIASKGVTGGHDYREVTPVTPSSRVVRTELENFSKIDLDEKVRGVPVDASVLVELGQVTERNGQRYVFTGGEDYTNKAGEVVELLSLHSRCFDCGSWFKFKTTARTKYWNVRCPSCIRERRGNRG